MSIYFSTGQICEIFSIPKQTLLYYDKIGLIKPDHINEKNLYRYYSIEQFSYLYLILALKTSGIELQQIKSYLNKHSTEQTFQLLSSQIQTLDTQIKKLQSAQNTFDQILNQIKYGFSYNEEKPYKYCYFEEIYLYALTIDDSDVTNDFSLTFSKLMHPFTDDPASRKWQYGWIVSLKPSGEFKNRELFLELDKPIDSPNLIIRPAGEYLSTFHKGSYDTLADTREKLLEYASEHSMTILGYLYERQLINKFITDDEHEFITEISIAVE
ncbi:MerR family transcriptional regulator [Sinanaerobacter sp. ZZT-01]|uniref:MerR family transcriptional regulator n=1 Tax=Sinanaerobacter sp. ZZT-01 TaxID=3111540 RepID=UPI002D77FD86|nr:MerR family transcriptional regulator [Sinanaerobacter sp. ZZT-01]WRR93020.1 MerR family transcriptional regulator [Sinanaerobacter sp. ZZT-01]